MKIESGSVVSVPRNVTGLGQVGAWRVEAIFCWRIQASAQSCCLVLLHPMWTRHATPHQPKMESGLIGSDFARLDKTQSILLDVNLVTGIKIAYRGCTQSCQQNAQGVIIHACDAAIYMLDRQYTP